MPRVRNRCATGRVVGIENLVSRCGKGSRLEVRHVHRARPTSGMEPRSFMGSTNCSNRSVCGRLLGVMGDFDSDRLGTVISRVLGSGQLRVLC